MKGKFIFFSKVALFFVIFGFFSPVACDQNAPQLANESWNFGSHLNPILVWAIFIIACISIFYTAYNLFLRITSNKGYEENLIFNLACTISMIVSGIIIYAKLFAERDGVQLKLQYGGVFVLCGFIVHTALLVLSLVFSSKTLLAKTPEETIHSTQSKISLPKIPRKVLNSIPFIIFLTACIGGDIISFIMHSTNIGGLTVFYGIIASILIGLVVKLTNE